jgi:hypothetical protein
MNIEFYMEIGYSGWFMPAQRPIIGNINCRYGGGEKQSESQSSSTSTRPSQNKALDAVLKAFTEQGRIGAGQESFEGARVAPLGETQQAAIGGAGDFLDTFSAGRDIPFTGETGSALRGVLGQEFGGELITPERAEEVFQATRVDPRLRQFERFDKPLIEEQFAGPNFQSSGRATAVTRAGEELGRDIASEREQFLFGTEQANRALQESRANRALSAIPLGQVAATLPETVAGARLAGRAGIFDIASAGQQQEQREIQAQREVFQEAQRFMDPEDFANLVALLNLNFSSSSESKTTFGPSPLSAGLSSLAGGIGGGIGERIGGTAFSGTSTNPGPIPLGKDFR